MKTYSEIKEICKKCEEKKCFDCTYGAWLEKVEEDAKDIMLEMRTKD